MTNDQIISWLLEGDVSIQYQAHRDLLGEDKPQLQERIASEGWGSEYLKRRNVAGHWGDRFYQPKWISTHYTVLDLKNLGISPKQPKIRESISQVIESLKGSDGGIFHGNSANKSDVCINGMFLNYAAYFGVEEKDLMSIIDFLLTESMKDGGFNCYSNSNTVRPVHSSMHSTISVLEGFLEFSSNHHSYRLNEIQKSVNSAQQFLLEHKLFRSHRTGEIIDKKMLVLSYPSRWKYDILRVLDYFQSSKIGYDPRMQDSIDILLSKRLNDGCWPVQSKHPGQTHFEMEKVGKASRWNTLRAMRVLKYFGEA